MRRNELDALSAAARQQVMDYACLNRKGELVMCGDDARFFNHSNKPNCADVADGEREVTTVAARRIKKGGELTCNYDAFDYSGKVVAFSPKNTKSGRNPASEAKLLLHELHILHSTEFPVTGEESYSKPFCDGVADGIGR